MYIFNMPRFPLFIHIGIQRVSKVEYIHKEVNLSKEEKSLYLKSPNIKNPFREINVYDQSDQSIIEHHVIFHYC